MKPEDEILMRFTSAAVDVLKYRQLMDQFPQFGEKIDPSIYFEMTSHETGRDRPR